MKLARSALAVCFLLASVPTAALTVDDYAVMKAKLTSADVVEANIARLSVVGYTQGVADALSVQRGEDNRKIPMIPGVSICLPPTVRLTGDLVKSALDQELEGHADFYASVPQWRTGYATQLAMAGLARMFPCNGEQ